MNALKVISIHYRVMHHRHVLTFEEHLTSQVAERPLVQEVLAGRQLFVDVLSSGHRLVRENLVLAEEQDSLLEGRIIVRVDLEELFSVASHRTMPQ